MSTLGWISSKNGTDAGYLRPSSAWRTTCVTDTVSWQGTGSQKMQEYLDKLVKDIRGEIVHKGTTPSSLGLTEVRTLAKGRVGPAGPASPL